MRILLSIIVLITATEMNIQGQNSLPYYEIPTHPDTYSAGNVMGRLVDGLGFRYYWATEGLRDEDLLYKPSAEGRALEETLDHVYGLSLTMVNAPQSIVNERPVDWSEMTFKEKRAQTLMNFQKASELMKAGDPDEMESYRVLFKRGENLSEFPFWNLINGPVSDALWHTGQLVLMRRAAGNPINPKVSVFTGKLRE